jgi:hypothetical protein
MSRFTVPNKSYIASQMDSKLATSLDAIERAINAQADQTNSDPTGATQATPSQVSAINVVAQGGIHDIQIQDSSPAYAGLNYVAEYSQKSDFSNYHTIDLKTSQNYRANLGDGQYYWRARSYYHAATPSEPVYHGGATPAPVGTGSYPGPPMQDRQGFTGPYRNSNTPPIRK